MYVCVSVVSGKPSKVFGLDENDLRNDAEKESIEFAGDDDNRNPYRVDDVACVDVSELTDEALQSERQRYVHCNHSLACHCEDDYICSHGNKSQVCFYCS